MDEESEWVIIVSNPLTLPLSPRYLIISRTLRIQHDIDISEMIVVTALSLSLVYDDNDVEWGDVRVRNVKW